MNGEDNTPSALEHLAQSYLEAESYIGELHGTIVCAVAGFVVLILAILYLAAR